MVAKFILVAVLVASVSASGGYSSFSYGVSDPNTGDIKDQEEKRVGGNVVGKYSLLESDGTKRIVEYSADDATGFKAVVHKEPVGTHGAAAIGNPVGHSAHLAQPGAIANPIAHHAPLAAVSTLNHHAASLGAASSLSHGAVPAVSHAAQAAAAHVAKVAHVNNVAQASHASAPLAHAGAISPVGQLSHSAAFAASAPLAYARPVAPLAASSPLAHGVYGNSLTTSAAHLSGQPGSLYSSQGNPLAGPLNFINRGGPTVSSYSHKILHNGPDSIPNGGAYGSGGYGYGGVGPYSTGLGNSALAHSNPWASNAALAQSNPWVPRTALDYGALTSPIAAVTGSRLGW